jgi:hypothetical protein
MNKFLGVCCEHGSDTSLEFTIEKDLQALWEELQGEKIHLAHEVCVNVCVGGAYLICHAPDLIGNSRCNRDSKSIAMTLQCTPHPAIWKL